MKIKKDYKKSFQNLKEKQQQYGHEPYKILSENEKEKLVEYRNKYYRMKNNTLL